MPTTPETPFSWTLTANGLQKTTTWKDFAEALAFVVAVGRVAESAHHHPDMDIRWNKVVLTLMTHSEGKVTQADYDLAEIINGLSADAVREASQRLW
ncbi:MAG: 4a-hydroxytetrahydrobiopterin dehydratase [Verrucomicrobia bacterium Tous-C9LFEB]|nr:MAG: 4a-hydroxytetrahydrobiopterin dehydratase [Verrucomicrobia bacterium Tous-C9LFEB]